MGVLKTNDHIQTIIRMPYPSQEPPVSSKAPNKDIDMDILCTFKVKIESQTLAYGCTKDQWPYSNHYQDAKPQSGTSSPHQRPKSELKLGFSLHLQNEDRETKIRIWHKQRSVNISISLSGCKTPVRNIQPPWNPQSGISIIFQSPKSGLRGHVCSLHLQN